MPPIMSREMSSAPSSKDFWDWFQFLQPDYVDNMLESVNPTCLLDCHPLWLIISSRHVLTGCVQGVVNASVWRGMVPSALKGTAVHRLLKGTSLDPEASNNYLFANIPLLGKVLKFVVAGQLQIFLEETDNLDSFQSGFSQGLILKWP